MTTPPKTAYQVMVDRFRELYGQARDASTPKPAIEATPIHSYPRVYLLSTTVH